MLYLELCSEEEELVTLRSLSTNMSPAWDIRGANRSPHLPPTSIIPPITPSLPPLPFGPPPPLPEEGVAPGSIMGRLKAGGAMGLGRTMEEGMREKSLLFEGASEVVLSLDEEGFLLRRCFTGLGLVVPEGSVDIRLMGSSLRDCLSRWGEKTVITYRKKTLSNSHPWENLVVP